MPVRSPIVVSPVVDVLKGSLHGELIDGGDPHSRAASDEEKGLRVLPGLVGGPQKAQIRIQRNDPYARLLHQSPGLLRQFHPASFVNAQGDDLVRRSSSSPRASPSATPSGGHQQPHAEQKSAPQEPDLLHDFHLPGMNARSSQGVLPLSRGKTRSVQGNTALSAPPPFVLSTSEIPTRSHECQGHKNEPGHCTAHRHPIEACPLQSDGVFLLDSPIFSSGPEKNSPSLAPRKAYSPVRRALLGDGKKRPSFVPQKELRWPRSAQTT